ncbi:ATP-binding protein [Bacteroidaceae bacterium HV4-6-C5C]|nr:ATP-binding protein [Bacteroidaceae bacterium HV4-6-C5C]
MENGNVICGSLFEDDYLIRSLGGIVTQPETALTELVANAWDAGATEVKIFIPSEKGQTLIVEDNGIGMSKEDFHGRWMKLRYNRLKHQGKKVAFPNGIQGTRFAYGRNGVGRHGLLCFNDNEYNIQTIKDGNTLALTLTTQIEGEPIAITNEEESKADNTAHGTKLEVVVVQNLPNIDRIRDVIAAKFLHDPQFKIEINRVSLHLEDLKGFLDQTTIRVPETEITVIAYFIDSQKAMRKSIYQGIAFWQGGRLVGEPSWILGQESILDGRTTLAKRYTVVISTNDLSEEVKEDWSGFKQSVVMQKVYDATSIYVNTKILELSRSSINETKAIIKQEFKEKLRDASPLMLYEIDEVIESISFSSPKARQESVIVAVDAIINLEKSKGGRELLAKLSLLNENDIEGLNLLLNKWTVKDALIVLNEIDRRLTVIEAIRKLSKDVNIDELHILHPLVTEARWLFGAEYDSAEYMSNRQLQTVLGALFKGKAIQRQDINYKKRPDIVCLDHSTMAITGTEEFATETELSTINKILIIELKRGGFNITRNERNQAEGYSEDLLASFPSARINAYVVGDTIDDNLQRVAKVGEHDAGKVYVVTFSQLVDTAEKRLFGLRQKLASMYDDVPGMELYQQTQMNFK